MTVALTRAMILGSALLTGMAAGAFVRSGMWSSLFSPTAVSSNQATAPPVVATTLTDQPPLPVPDGYTPIGKDQAVYVVETEENNNVKLSAGHYQDGKKVGYWEFYYPTGALKQAGEFKNDVRVGMWRSYYPDMQIMSEGRYDEKGNRTGVWVGYYANGHRKCEGTYSGDLRIGYWIEFPDQNAPDSYWHGKYNVHGQIDQDWEYYESGICRSRAIYDNGQLVKQEAVEPSK